LTDHDRENLTESDPVEDAAEQTRKGRPKKGDLSTTLLAELGEEESSSRKKRITARKRGGRGWITKCTTSK